MSEHEFEIVREFEVEQAPEQVWAAITTGTAGWLWPMEYEPKEGGAAPFGGVVAVWDPPHRLVARAYDLEGVPQTFNQLDHTVEPGPDGGSRVRYVHSGIFVENWEDQYDGADKHTDFYLHTLREYLRHFAGRPAAFATADGPAAAGAGDALAVAERALRLPADAAVGDTVSVLLPGAAAQAPAVLDFRTDDFVGLRTPDAMYRIFARNNFGAVLGLSIHDFAPGADSARLDRDAREWLTATYA
jgi:uncharacterized protein YndB with AHSA1/START domain